MFDPSAHRLLHPLILSLLIHAAILFGAVSLLPARMDAPVATMSVIISNDAARVAPVPMQNPSPPAPASRSSGAQTRAKVGQLVVEKSPVLASVPPTVQPPLPESALPSSPVANQLAESVGPQTNVQNSLPVQVREGVSANDLRQYRLSLAIAARRFKHYPALARERGWEGTVALMLAVRSHQVTPGVSVVRSSGHPALDRQAQEMMAQAARVTALPEGLMGRDFQIELPVQFSLDDDQ